ncbi:hypothetical protein FPOAC1_003577 [Fusarium poae]|uniref:hypothetical protein n=1 Tax=Fusarium poae TaxID=36050 RepID=UPI001CE7D905|nr:hypothetical protein FPOAC1_003577 [Fusarium poae]KAG8677554.1 hypothetical protein FPOAC1_003577 [Fusarium poae]
MEQFPQVIASLQQVSASAAALTAAVQSGTQSVPGQVRVQDGANTIKQAMKYAINTKSSIEEYEEYEGENAPKKRASQEATNTAISQVTPALQALAEGIRRSQESFPDNVASELKSVLEEFETFQSSWEQLAQANGTSAGNYIPGILHMLSQSLDGAFEKLGGR